MKIRDHCHRTGKHKDTAQTICNLKLKSPMKSLYVFITVQSMIIILS